MFRVTRSGDDRLDIDLSGKLDSEGMRVALDELVRQSEGIRHGRMLYRIGEFELPTPGAIRVELSRLPGLFRWVRAFDRVAVVVDRKWIRTVSELEGALIPGLVIKAFRPDQEGEAEAWLENGRREPAP